MLYRIVRETGVNTDIYEPTGETRDTTAGEASAYCAAQTASTGLRYGSVPIDPMGSVNAQPGPPGLITQAAVSLTTANAAVQIVPARAERKYLAVWNRSPAATVDLGNVSVQTGSGIPVYAGGGFVFTGAAASGAVFGISSTAGASVSYAEA